MKKILCIISVLLCILLTACGDAKSIGIIGGADGPTSVTVTEKGEINSFKEISSLNFRIAHEMTFLQTH
mgnify:CR=1 FL=1